MNKYIQIENRKVGKDYPAYIIAEAGVNHNGDVNLAKKLIDVAVEAGADAVKFQTFKSESVISRYMPKAEYQKKTTGADETQLEMIKKLELSFEAHYKLLKHCEKKNILFLSTPFDMESVDFLNDIGLPVIKIPSGEITNLPYLKKIGHLKKKVILSTGMSTLDEIKDALSVLCKSGTPKRDIIILHCNTEYPTPIQDVNLRAMSTIRKEFQTQVGYSDHTIGTEVAIASVVLGATVIEKHFTLDKGMIGPDHKASLDPTELKYLVRAIRNVEHALGKNIKKPSPSELKNIDIMRKVIVSKSKISKGDIFTEDNITVKRAGKGISPMYWDKVRGKTANKNYKEDEKIIL